MGPNPHDPLFVAAFRAALVRQGTVIVLAVAVLWLAWASVRRLLPRDREQPFGTPGPADPAEPAGRRVLRIGFGVLWLLDGLLQAQPTMAAGLPSQVIEPSAAGSPAWVLELVSWSATLWYNHPIQSAAAVVWIQVGIGGWLLTASRGRWSQAAGLTSAGWGLVVGACGESFGGIFASGLTWLTGAPGAVASYCVAGGLIALPARAWLTPRLGRLALATSGIFLIGMAVLQALPGQGFWHGMSGGQPGAKASMIQDMAQPPQPGFLPGLINGFTAFDEAHGFAVNLFA